MELEPLERPHPLPAAVDEPPAPPDTWARRTVLTLGMPQLDGCGLSETWLQKACGEIHWRGLADHLGQPAQSWTDTAGRRVYAAFAVVRLGAARLDAAREGQTLRIDSELSPVGRSQAWSRHRLSTEAGCLGSLEMLSAFVSRGQAGSNRSIRRVPMQGRRRVDAPAAAQHLAERTRAWRAVAAAGQPAGEPRRSVTFQSCARGDFNGAGLVYFATFTAWVDRALSGWGLLGVDDRVLERECLFLGNLDPGHEAGVSWQGQTRVAQGRRREACVRSPGDGRLLAVVRVTVADRAGAAGDAAGTPTPGFAPADLAAWQAAAARSAPGGDVASLGRTTPDGIAIKPLYTAADIAGLPFTDTLPGVEPFVRGPHATMYAGRPWTIRQYAGFSTARESNAFYRRTLAAGAQGISVAFDLPTQRGYDSDHPHAAADAGQAGVAIDSVEDMKILFDGVALDQVSVSMTMNGAVLPVLAAFVVAAEEQGVPAARLSGTIQNDILKEFLVRNAYIYPLAPSMRIIGDVISYASANLPRFNSISVSGYHLQEAGASPALELAFALANGKEYVRTALARGLDVDAFAARLSFFWAVGMDFYPEIAKLRAARLLWCRIMKDFGATRAASLMLRAHCQTSGCSLTEQDPHNNVVRTTLEALAAVFGGTQSLHTNALDEAVSLPTPSSARIARATQLILQEETHIADVVDPWAGSYLMETLTRQMADAASVILDEIEAAGGMARAVDSGWAKLRIATAAVERQARVDSGRDVIVGVNKYRPQTADAIESRAIDPAQVRETQAALLKTVRATRDAARVRATLQALTGAADTGEGNLLALAIDAMRARATVGEVCAALESVYGRHQAELRTMSGVYAAAYDAPETWQRLQQDVARFARQRGCPPRLMIAKLGEDGHDRGAQAVAAAFGDLGFDIVLGPLFQAPAACARRAVEQGVHAVGVSTLAAGHRVLVPALIQALEDLGAAHVLVFVGGVVARADHQFLVDAGVKGIYGPGTPIGASAQDVLAQLARTGRG